jgi:hypothetical protein
MGEKPLHAEHREGVLWVWDPGCGQVCAEVRAEQVAVIRALEMNGLRVTRTSPRPVRLPETLSGLP